MPQRLGLPLIFLLAFPGALDAFLVCYGFFGRVDDLGWTYAHNLARAWADAVLGTESRYVESVYWLPDEQQKAVMDGFIAAKCDLIVTGSDTLLPLTLEYAGRYPQTKFMCIAGTVSLPNLGGAYVRVYQGSYIAGMLAAMQPGVDKIGYVGSMYAPDSLRNVNAFALGVRAVRPQAQTLLMHVGSWLDTRLEDIATRRLIKKHGVDLLTYDSDSTTVVAVARELGKYSIAMKSDGTALLGESNLLSQIYVWNTIFVDMVSAAMNDTLWAIAKDKNKFVGFEKDAVYLGTLSSKVPAASRLEAKRMAARFAAGDDPVFCGTFESFCPKDSGHNPLDILLWPCANLSRRTPNISAGETCLDDVALRSMTWLVKDAVLDLGLLKVPDECPPGTRLDALSEALCVTCEPGRFAEGEDQVFCKPCPAGFYSDSEGSSLCKVCPLGHFSGAAGAGATACTSCPPGQYADDPGVSECRSCAAGFSGSTSGSTACSACEEGSFSNATGASFCQACTPPKTSKTGSEREDDCVCPEGTISGEDGSCAPCPRGMVCPRGPSLPVLAARFWSAPVEPGARFVYSVYRCRDDRECPGGPMGTCATNREGVACAQCRPGTAPSSSSGGCESCRGGPALSLTIICIVIPVLLGLLLMYSQMDMSRARGSAVDLGVCLGQSVIASQLVSLVGSVAVPWVEPLKTFTRVVSIITFRIEVLNVSCIIPEHDIVGLFVAKLLLFPAIAAVFSIIYTLASWCRRMQFQRDRLLDGLGVVFVMLYLTLTMVSLLPFRCLESPNGTRSLSDNPAVICDGNQRYTQMAALGATGLLVYTSGFFSTVVVATIRFPKLVASGHGEKMMVRYRFLFHRFAASRYFYAPMYLFRNLVLALVPVIFASHAHQQVIAFATIMLCSLTLQSWLQPWRSTLPNVVDSTLSTCIVMALVVAGILLPDPMDMNQFLWDLQVYGGALLGVALACLFLVLTHLAARRCLLVHDFVAFLTHHKLACAAGARLMKLELEELTAGRVFLDSDHLENLLSLLDIVRCGTRTLVVLLTKETLWRPWCAGEIATASCNSVPCIAVAYDDYEDPCEEDLDIGRLAAGAKWPIQAFAPLTLQGVTLEAVRAAYVSLKEQPKLVMKRVQACLSQDVHQAGKTMGQLVEYCVGRPTNGWSPPPSVLDIEGGISLEAAVIADRMEGEAISTARILVQLLRVQAQKTIGDLLYFQPESTMQVGGTATGRSRGSSSSGPAHLLVLLTPGALTSAAFAQCLVGARRAWPSAELLTCRVPGWRFPPHDVLEGGILKQVSTAAALPLGELAAEYAMLLSLIAMPLSPEAHMSVLSAELARITYRILASGTKMSILGSPSLRSSEAAAPRSTFRSNSKGSFNSKGSSGKKAEYASGRKLEGTPEVEDEEEATLPRGCDMGLHSLGVGPAIRKPPSAPWRPGNGVVVHEARRLSEPN